MAASFTFQYPDAALRDIAAQINAYPKEVEKALGQTLVAARREVRREVGRQFKADVGIAGTAITKHRVREGTYPAPQGRGQRVWLGLNEVPIRYLYRKGKPHGSKVFDPINKRIVPKSYWQRNWQSGNTFPVTRVQGKQWPKRAMAPLDDRGRRYLRIVEAHLNRYIYQEFDRQLRVAISRRG